MIHAIKEITNHIEFFKDLQFSSRQKWFISVSKSRYGFYVANTEQSIPTTSASENVPSALSFHVYNLYLLIHKYFRKNNVKNFLENWIETEAAILDEATNR